MFVLIKLYFLPCARIEDPNERASLEAQILEFGQTPKQLFTNPHPQKLVNKTAIYLNLSVLLLSAVL